MRFSRTLTLSVVGSGLFVLAVGAVWAFRTWKLHQPVPAGHVASPEPIGGASPAVWKLGQSWPAPTSNTPFRPGQFFFPEIMGVGCALFDFDRDGLLDVYLLCGSGSSLLELGNTALGNTAESNDRPRNRLLKQTRIGQFEDVSAESGADVADLGMGVAVGDVNNDGWPDLFLANYGPDRLLINQKNGKFKDVTQAAGVQDLNWGASACFIDFDRDGWLDLCVVNYLNYDPGRPCPDPEGKLDYCNPKLFDGVPARLYRNLSGQQNGSATDTSPVRFQDVSLESGIGLAAGPGLGIVSGDFNDDAWPDLYVANDGAANYLWINQKDGTFTEEAIPRSAAYDSQGRPQASMGIALGDVDRDGAPDLLVSHLKGENHALYRNEPQIGFTEDSYRSTIASSSFSSTGFGDMFGDLDLDGHLDAVVVNGAVRRPNLGMIDDVSRVSVDDYWAVYAEPSQMFLNNGQGIFEMSTPFPGRAAVSRGLACGDIDNDGDLDLLVSEANGAARLYLNELPRRGHWLQIRAIEPLYGGRDAYGARIRVETGGESWTGWVNSGGSYLSSSDPVVHFGLGPISAVDRIVVTWPNGDVEHFPGSDGDQRLTLSHGTGTQP